MTNHLELGAAGTVALYWKKKIGYILPLIYIFGLFTKGVEIVHQQSKSSLFKVYYVHFENWMNYSVNYSE